MTGTIAASGESFSLTYRLTEARAVSLQALSEAAQPTLTILHDGTVVAQQPNAEGVLVVSLTAYLAAGDYVVEVGTVNNTTGSVVIFVQTEVPIAPVPLPLATLTNGTVSAAAPLALYSFSALPEPSYLYLDSTSVQIRLLDTTTGRVSATLNTDLLGARLRLPAGTALYQLEIAHDGSSMEYPFSLCLAAVSADTCGNASAPAPTPNVPSTALCTVAPLYAGGANIRQSASPYASVLVALPGGATADVLGISPDGTWYNVTYSGVTGWAALSAVTSNGNCSSLPIVNPPPVPPTPVPPTLTPTPIPPTSMPTLTPTPAGPCVIKFSADELVYTQPIVDPAYIYDEISAGGEAIVVGHWNAGGEDWWKTNYAGAWWLNAPGTAGQLTGDCSSIPMITP
ncbi:MAG TPA: SH3 domain-containing protein [Aggregatilineaceae bacterium]|nr:SH3 domain-containing protein [Aggregatilineaceae bacterium]